MHPTTSGPGATPGFVAREYLVEVDGSPLRVLDAGRGDAVLLGPSYLWSAEMWRPQIEALARHYRVVVPDLWGHGGSGRLPKTTHDISGLARQHLAVMDALGIESFAMCGLSVGGMWAFEMACLAPHRVRAVALLDSFIGAEPEPAKLRFFSMLDAVARSGAVPAPVLDATVPMFFAPDIVSRRPDLPARFRAALQDWPQDRLLDSVVPLGRMIFGRRDALGDASRLRMPRIVLHGAADIPRSVDEAEQMARALACQLTVLPGVGHIASLEAPEVVTEHLLGFLQQAGLGALV
ncbi:alpha/beta fold hydrolase [Belnapia sp. T18]|uniref:Alpha/beta fold hydrolase n=1 Tax=Belnapia arida TaxID=2804533 RepID=A0ABS1TWN8_9PROT|nr:alpha/beta fold hydrolase [Belnapia arida]MBL6076863.1 alpha/beta fold hydrolase [Belnapia arida]